MLFSLVPLANSFSVLKVSEFAVYLADGMS